MGIDPILLRDQCRRTVHSTDLPELGRRIEGKVRDCYVQGDRRVLIASDRVSCFDVVVGTIPFKGQVLNQLALVLRQLARQHLRQLVPRLDRSLGMRRVPETLLKPLNDRSPVLCMQIHLSSPRQCRCRRPAPRPSWALPSSTTLGRTSMGRTPRVWEDRGS